MNNSSKYFRLFDRFSSIAKQAFFLTIMLSGTTQTTFAETGRMYSVSENKPSPIPATTVFVYPCGAINNCESFVGLLKEKDALSTLLETGKQQFTTSTDINGQFSYKCPESECLVYARGSDAKNTYIWASIIKSSSSTFELNPLNHVMTLPVVKVNAYLCQRGLREDKKLKDMLEGWYGCSIGDFMLETKLVPDSQGEITLPTGEQGYFYKLALRKDGDIIFGNPFQYNSCTISLLTTKNGIITGIQARTKGNDVISSLMGDNSRICKRALKGKKWE